MRRTALALFGLLLCGSAVQGQVTLYVSPSGNDAWTGTLPAPNATATDGPLATLQAARDAVRLLKAAGRAAEGVKVMMRGGTYQLTNTLVLGPEDSGSEGAPVVYEAFPGERPVISGGRLIRGWRRSQGQLWVAEIPKGWYFTRLFVNGSMAVRSREPDTDNWGRWFQVVEGGPPEEDAPEGMGSRMFRFPEGTLKAWGNPGDIEINSLPSFRYANFIAPLERVDEAERMATLVSMAYYNFQPGDPFRVENAPEALDRPGEWCVNTVEGTVTYWPREGEDMTTAEVVAPALTKLVRFQGDEQTGAWVHDIVLRGLTFTHCDRHRWNETPPEDEANLHILDSAVYLEGTERCAIEDCRFVDVAGFGVRFNLTCRNNRFVRNEVVGAGCGGIQVGGYGPGIKDTNHGHTITHNHIHHSSTDWWHAGAIDLRQSGDNWIAYNLIHHMPYTAISISGAHTAYFQQYRERGPGVGRAKYNFRWDEIPADNPLTAESVKPFLHGRNNVVEHNVVYEVLGRLPADGGALYGFGQGLGNVFRNNLVYRAHCLAIYLDNEFDGVLVQDNVVFDSASAFGGSGAYPTLVGNALYAPGTAPPEVRTSAAQLTRMAEQATGPCWHRPRGAAEVEPVVVRDPLKREFQVSFAEMVEEELPGQGGWNSFGFGAYVSVVMAPASGAVEGGMVAEAGGLDSWASISHGMILDPARDIVLEIQARLAEESQANGSFEVYLNRGQVHASEAFGVAIVGGAEDSGADLVGLRQDSAGARVLGEERLIPGQWYLLRLEIAAGSQAGRLYLQNLTAGDPAPRPVVFRGGAEEADLTAGETWAPALPELDALVLRLGGAAQVKSITLRN